MNYYDWIYEYVEEIHLDFFWKLIITVNLSDSDIPFIFSYTLIAHSIDTIANNLHCMH